MKRMAAILAVVLGSSMLYAQGMGQDKSQGTEMTGYLCSSKCVKQDAAKASCDTSCSDETGDTVFVDDGGTVTKVANPEIAKGKMGKRVKVHCDMMKDTNMMKIYDVVFANVG